MLTGREIEHQHRVGAILISPFSESRIGPNSYDLTLANDFIEYGLPKGYIDPEDPTSYVIEHFQIPEDGQIFYPGGFYLGSTVESVGSEEFIMTLADTSSYARLGISTHFNAGFGDLGFGMNGENWTLEITVRHPIKLRPGMKIAQIGFEVAEGSRFIDYRKTGRYVGKKGTVPYIPKPSA